MAGRWAQPFKDRKELKATLNPMGLSFHICWFLGAIFAVLGLIAGAMNSALGLEPTYWLLLAIAAFLAAIGHMRCRGHQQLVCLFSPEPPI